MRFCSTNTAYLILDKIKFGCDTCHTSLKLKEDEREDIGLIKQKLMLICESATSHIYNYEE